MSRTILLIHGAWLNGVSFDGFKARYEAQGYTVVAPSWPYDDRPVSDLNSKPDPRLTKVGVKEIVEHYEREIRKLPEQPIIMGHSAGGVFTQILMDRGHGVAGVIFNPAPTTGVRIPLTTLLSALPVFITWGSWGKSLTMSRKFFATRFAQTAPEHEKSALYDRYIIPTPGKVYWDGLVSSVGKIKFGNPKRAPLLIVGGKQDLIAEAKMTRGIFNKQKRSPSHTELKIFPGSHWQVIDDGWQQIADFALDWAARNARSSATAPSIAPRQIPAGAALA